MNYAKILVVLSLVLISTSSQASSGENHIQYTPDGYVVKIKQSGVESAEENQIQNAQSPTLENHSRTPSNLSSGPDSDARENASRGTH